MNDHLAEDDSAPRPQKKEARSLLAICHERITRRPQLSLSSSTLNVTKFVRPLKSSRSRSVGTVSQPPDVTTSERTADATEDSDDSETPSHNDVSSGKREVFSGRLPDSNPEQLRTGRNGNTSTLLPDHISEQQHRGRYDGPAGLRPGSVPQQLRIGHRRGAASATQVDTRSIHQPSQSLPPAETSRLRWAASSSMLSPSSAESRRLSSSKSIEFIPYSLGAHNHSTRPRSSTSSYQSMSLAQQIAAEDRRRKTERELRSLQYNATGDVVLDVPQRQTLQSNAKGDIGSVYQIPGNRLTGISTLSDVSLASDPGPGAVEPKARMSDDQRNALALTSDDDPLRLSKQNDELRDRRNSDGGHTTSHTTSHTTQGEVADRREEDEIQPKDSVFSELQKLVEALGARKKQVDTRSRSIDYPTFTELPLRRKSLLLKKNLSPYPQSSMSYPAELEGSLPSPRFELEGNSRPASFSHPIGQRERFEREVASRPSAVCKINQEWDARQKFNVPIFHHAPN